MILRDLHLRDVRKPSSLRIARKTMFAVPGWSVSSDSIKREERNSQQSAESPKKRKRGHQNAEQNKAAQPKASDFAAEKRKGLPHQNQAKRTRNSEPVNKRSTHSNKPGLTGTSRSSAVVGRPRDASQKPSSAHEGDAQPQKAAKKGTSILKPTESESLDFSRGTPTKSPKLTPLQQAMQRSSWVRTSDI